MKRFKSPLLITIASLYVVTWIGGWIRHAQDIRADAWVQYRKGEKLNAESEKEARRQDRKAFVIQLHDGGPKTGVIWCLPILPGILLADSYSSYGPLGGRGTAKIVFYYGTGSTVICELWGWIS
jgi:hypothetical protein